MSGTKKFGKRRYPYKRNLDNSDVNILNDNVFQSNITSNIVDVGDSRYIFI